MSAAFGSIPPASNDFSDSSLVTAYTCASTHEKLQLRDDSHTHYLAIPVDAVNTRSVTIRVYYDNSTTNSQPKVVETKLLEVSEEEQQKTGKAFLALTTTMDKKQQVFDPFINQNPDNDVSSFDDSLHTDNDPMLLDIEELNGNNFMMGDTATDDPTDCFVSKNMIVDEKHDSLFFDDGLDGSDDYANANVVADTYQSAFDANISDANPQQTNLIDDFRVIKRFGDSDAASAPTTNFLRTIDFEAERLEIFNDHSHHQNFAVQNTSPTPLKMYRCTFDHCGKMFPSQRGLKYHSVGHAPGIYACSKCRKTFASMLKLKRHAMIHDNVRPFPCDYPECQKSFTTKSNLNVHRRTHTGEKPYVCSVCSRAFSHQSHAKAHLKIHLKKLQLSSTTANNNSIANHHPH